MSTSSDSIEGAHHGEPAFLADAASVVERSVGGVLVVPRLVPWHIRISEYKKTKYCGV